MKRFSKLDSVVVARVATLALMVSVPFFLAPGYATDETNSGLSAPPNGSFPDPSLNDWVVKSFAGHTRYSVVPAGNDQVLEGFANGTASVLYREQTVPVGETPWLSWSWRIENTYGSINEQSKNGDDFPARLYVVVRTGFLPWETVAINYVWSSSTPIDTSWVNPFTKKSVMLAIQSGDEGIGAWRHERRNVVSDFRTFFDMEITEIDGYAVMVDGDNTGKKATAFFGNIAFTAD